MKRLSIFFLFILLLTGCLLLAFNISGFFLSMRPSGYPGLPKSIFSDIRRVSGESDIDYLTRILDIVHSNMIFFNVDPKSLKTFNLRVPVTENWILNSISVLKPKYIIYEFASYKKALERGSGLCSQFAICYADILNDNGMNAKILPLGDHVAVSIAIKCPREYEVVADPYFNVIIPYSYSEIKNSPVLIKQYYQGKTSQACIDQLSISYRTSPYSSVSIKNYTGWKSYYFEPISYFLKWAIPFALILPFAISYIIKRRLSLALQDNISPPIRH